MATKLDLRKTSHSPSKHTQGFTIIEMMLVLAVSAMLAVGILVGSGVAIGQQRYKDSVNSLKAFIQEQYNETTNVENTRSGSESCSAAVVVPAAPTPDARGTTDCLSIGRVIVVDTAGTTVTASTVVGYRDPAAPVEDTDIAEIDHYTLKASPIDQEVKSVDWEAKVIDHTTGAPQPITMMIIRSPLSGSVMTFVESGVQSDLNATLASAGYSTFDLCVQGPAGFSMGQSLAVRINPGATNAGGIEIPSESANVCN